jgi:hypothetical protein
MMVISTFSLLSSYKEAAVPKATRSGLSNLHARIDGTKGPTLMLSIASQEDWP